MRRFVVVVLGLMALTVPVVAVPGATVASAAEPSIPRVVTPAAGASVARPFAGPVSIDFTNATPGMWAVLVTDTLSGTGHGDYYRSPTTDGYHWVTVEEGTGIVDVALDAPINKAGQYRVAITAPSGGTATVTSTFTVTGSGYPRILTPTEGQTVYTGYTGPVSIDFSDAPVGPYSFVVQGIDDPNYRASITFKNTNDTGTLSGTLWNPIPTEGAYSGDVRPFTGVGSPPPLDQVTFTALTPFAVTGVSANPATFYPRVRDDYRDETRIDFTTNRPATVTATVLNSAGNTVRTSPAGSPDWYWDGRNDDGTVVPTGTYRVRLDAVTGRGERATATAKVIVASDIVTRTTTQTKRGVSTSQQYALGCDIREDDPWLTLDCWNGKYADAIYRFALPRDAWAVDWKVRGTMLCCDRGKFIRTGTRVDKRTYRVHVGVTDWRAYAIRSVAVTYKHKVRR